MKKGFDLKSALFWSLMVAWTYSGLGWTLMWWNPTGRFCVSLLIFLGMLLPWFLLNRKLRKSKKKKVLKTLHWRYWGLLVPLSLFVTWWFWYLSSSLWGSFVGYQIHKQGIVAQWPPMGKKPDVNNGVYWLQKAVDPIEADFEKHKYDDFFDKKSRVDFLSNLIDRFPNGPFKLGELDAAESLVLRYEDSYKDYEMALDRTMWDWGCDWSTSMHARVASTPRYSPIMNLNRLLMVRCFFEYRKGQMEKARRSFEQGRQIGLRLDQEPSLIQLSMGNGMTLKWVEKLGPIFLGQDPRIRRDPRLIDISADEMLEKFYYTLRLGSIEEPLRTTDYGFSDLEKSLSRSFSNLEFIESIFESVYHHPIHLKLLAIFYYPFAAWEGGFDCLDSVPVIRTFKPPYSSFLKDYEDAERHRHYVSTWTSYRDLEYLPTFFRSLLFRVAEVRTFKVASLCCRFKAKNGSFPKDIDELKPYLKSWNDMIDPFSGNELILKSSKNSFTVYSVGPDLKDDGGKLCQWGHWVGDVGFTFPMVAGPK